MWMILSSLRVTPKVYYLFNPFFTVSFLGVEVMRSKQGILLSHWKYVFDLLSKTRKLGAKPCGTPMTPNVQITKEVGLFEDPERYRRLVRKFNYLCKTR